MPRSEPGDGSMPPQLRLPDAAAATPRLDTQSAVDQRRRRAPPSCTEQRQRGPHGGSGLARRVQAAPLKRRVRPRSRPTCTSASAGWRCTPPRRAPRRCAPPPDATSANCRSPTTWRSANERLPRSRGRDGGAALDAARGGRRQRRRYRGGRHADDQRTAARSHRGRCHRDPAGQHLHVPRQPQQRLAQCRPARTRPRRAAGSARRRSRSTCTSCSPPTVRTSWTARSCSAGRCRLMHEQPVLTRDLVQTALDRHAPRGRRHRPRISRSGFPRSPTRRS